jgi:hypothetical protein
MIVQSQIPGISRNVGDLDFLNYPTNPDRNARTAA